MYYQVHTQMKHEHQENYICEESVTNGWTMDILVT